MDPKKKQSQYFQRILWGICLGILLVTAGSWRGKPAQAAQQTEGYSIQFFGSGYGDIDRIKIPLLPQKTVNIGSTDFTMEWWLKANPGDNEAAAACMENDGWIYGNILLDRDVWDAGDYGDFGIALSEGRIAFGVNNGADGTTLCGETNTADGAWHHVAVTRQASSGMLAIYVDGSLDAQAEGPLGDIRYREGRSTPYEDDPFLVIGAEKHDAGSDYPSFRGWVDELRISGEMRYNGNFSPPAGPFTTDGATIALYHFDEGSAGPCTGAVQDEVQQNPGMCQYGGDTDLGPVYSPDQPFAASLAAEATAAPTQAIATATQPAATERPTIAASFAPTPAEAGELLSSPTAVQQATPSAVTPEDQTEELEPKVKPLYLIVLGILLLGVAAIRSFLKRKR